MADSVYITLTCEWCNTEYEHRKSAGNSTYCSKACQNRHIASKNKASEEEMIQTIRSVAAELGRVPTTDDIDEYGDYSSSQYYNRFGSWNTACERAGFEPSQRLNVPEEVLLEELQEIHSNIGQAPVADDIRKHGDWSVGAYYRAFGDLKTARRKAGMNPLPKQSYQKYTDNELIGMIERVGDVLVGRPTRKQVAKRADVSTATIENRFGTWSEAVSKAGYSRRPHGQDHPKWRGGKSVYDAVKRQLGPEAWREVRRRHAADCCRMCGASKDLHVHHIVPIMAGGINEDWNLMTLCASCHTTAENYTRSLMDSVLLEQ